MKEEVAGTRLLMRGEQRELCVQSFQVRGENDRK